ncbi:helix-turn-helix domain-containing protein [Chitinophaga flava]|uniref:AraC family transcriptional regulator n=1 Tax=Chitinophaga flava TaxID=2259036 RepID=A0A365XWB2_9BACT|nr:AraC family transcriptional regulator [Chitinophaga flava]RBL90659.1 AraC family transcriptional regulator [Chitinophaga flava]
MKAVHADTGEYLFGLKPAMASSLARPSQFSEYTVIFIPSGSGTYQADFSTFSFNGPVLLFATPFQALRLQADKDMEVLLLQFHGDFYCIEQHHSEVACNGLLFNNIYLWPYISLSAAQAADFTQLLTQLGNELHQEPPSGIVLKAYLQLLLAKSSTIRLQTQTARPDEQPQDKQMEAFRQLLDQHYRSLHKPADYASMLAISPNHLSKRCKGYFGKSPSQLIQDRLVLEAKKQLHLTRKSIKEIAYELQFEDEFYFSRFFKKMTKVSPRTFRRRTGISVVADLSM